MGRKKQSHPQRSGGITGNSGASDNVNSRVLESSESAEPSDLKSREENMNFSKPVSVEIDRSYWDIDFHFDIAEIILTNVRFSDEFSGYKFTNDFFQESKCSLRFQMHMVEEKSFKLGHWPVISADNICLEFISQGAHCSEDKNMPNVILSGNFDGPDEGVSGLVHLVSLKLLMLRPVPDFTMSEGGLSFRLRVEILKNTFDACGSLLELARQPWKRSMMNVMAWLRPEVATQEAKYGINKSKIKEINRDPETMAGFGSRRHARFDAAGFYEAIRPSKEEPMLGGEMPDLLPQLRPYQSRAACWMVKRERGTSEVERKPNQFIGPYSLPVDLLDMHLQMFYNPFGGNVSLQPQCASSHVPGGILADEMGLGKTVELLACIFAHRRSYSVDDVTSDDGTSGTECYKSNMKRLKRERVDCICGAVTESASYKGLWVQCDNCDAWQHADCVGYSPRETPSDSHLSSKKKSGKKLETINTQGVSKNKDSVKIVVMDGSFMCSSCCELIQATGSTIRTGATLIVCPAPILPQWHAEIIRHTNPGSVKTYIYEGVRNLTPSVNKATDLNDLASSDIVLTTYDVLKDDLSHDSDRHDGDRRVMRFEKKYPVVPTPLTRIFWWRICLDEAQMVESNTAAATEMAMRLHGQHRWCITGTPIQRRLDDLFGLLRFLGASPFDVHRWWVEIIRDPYEQSDLGAMEFTHNFFKEIMWRSCKLHVSDELQLPPQEECVSWLTFSPIEAHFYQRQHETCVRFAHEVIGRIKDEVKKRNSLCCPDSSSDTFLGHNDAAKLLHSLLKLRQACCHPQVGSSGLRSLQQSPMTMEEILDVLVGKAKIEGEEALRKSVVTLNGLAGIAVIEQDFPRAVSLYQEALLLAKENSDDFRLDPLLNLHIHHNLADLLPSIVEGTKKCQMGVQVSQDDKDMSLEFFDKDSPKRRKISNEDDGVHLKQCEKLKDFTKDMPAVGVSEDKDMKNVLFQPSHGSLDENCLKMACEIIKQKYLSVFVSKLSLAQLEFRNSYTQVCEAFTEYEHEPVTWWLQALDHIEKDKDSSNELVRKIDEAVSGSINNSKSRISSRFRSISGLKYLIQTGLDSLESSRQALIERLLEIDQSMEKPRDEDIELVRYCPNCQANADGPICVHCELDELFQVYEARLFRLKRGDNGAMIASAEEAVDLQKKKFKLNRFFGALSHSNKSAAASSVSDEESRRQRETRANIVVSRSPSELEIILGVIKNYSRMLLGSEAKSAAKKQLHLFEVLRKEFPQARYLAIAQAQILRAHDEIKMATSRLRLRETEEDASAIDALSSEELIVASVDFSNEKFLSVASLSCIKGQLRYLKGLVKQKMQGDSSSTTRDPASVADSHYTTAEVPARGDDEPCPICHEKLSNHKMVFQCGHLTCCKCFVEMTQQLPVLQAKCQEKWIPCPTCRQRTVLGNIAYVDDRQSRHCNDGIPIKFDGQHASEINIHVKGSYGTKIEAITRRILCIKATDPEAKVLVFSSWNDVLDVLEHAFEVNSITHIRMKGGRKSNAAIMQFKGQRSGGEGRRKTLERQSEHKAIQVLLLLIQHGANGLNLLEAQHIILIEPLLNPAVEAQAVSRVHRIGQKKRTFVHRFIVKDSVEESIYKLNRSRSANLTAISGNTKNQDLPVLTLKDVESIFSPVASCGLPENNDSKVGSLRHLPPAVAAALAAERRLHETTS